jgi:hypothetical protein
MIIPDGAKVLTCNFDLEIPFKQYLEVLECLRSVESGCHISWNGSSFTSLSTLSPLLYGSASLLKVTKHGISRAETCEHFRVI